jgi:hypothetical protein
MVNRNGSPLASGLSPGDVHRHDHLLVYQPQRCGTYQVECERNGHSYHADPEGMGQSFSAFVPEREERSPE